MPHPTPIEDFDQFKLLPLKELTADESSQSWNCYAILWSGSQSFSHEVLGQVLHIPKNHFLYLGPNKKHRFLNPLSSDGFALIFSTLFYCKNDFDIFMLENNPLFSASTQVYTAPNFIDKISLFKEAYMRYFASSSPTYEESQLILKYRIARNVLERIILNGVEKNELSYEVSLENSYDFRVSQEFKNLLHKHIVQQKSIPFYAEKLGLTVKKLNKITEGIYNRSAKELLTDYLTDKAKIHLTKTDMTIKEISWDLGFEQENNFSAFFKNQTDTTPREFRKKQVSS